MNTKTSKIEWDETQIKIDIVLKSIKFFKREFKCAKSSLEINEDLKVKLQREEQNLFSLKKKYPEYFI